MFAAIRSSAARLAGVAVLLGAAGCASLGGPGSAEEVVPARPLETGATVRSEGKYVVVDLDVNELRFMDGSRVLWSAPVGTGTGFRLRDGDTEWDFSTPRGLMHVQYKELNPEWILPDWYFVENKLPIPPADSPKRKQPGGLGAAAVFIGDELAIHGTDKPELLGQRVSHGCIRLSNENALRLFHNVQVGTPIRIVGGPDRVAQEQPDSVAEFTRPREGGAKKAADPLARISTRRLLQRLDRELESPDSAAAWTAVAGELIARGLKDDAIALRGVLARAGKSPHAEVNEEYATFLADAFSRGALRAVVSLARIGAEARERAAAAIVAATMELYHGPQESPTAPWPTRRVPRERLGPDGRAGWTAIQEAEARYRAGGGSALARQGR